MHILPKPHINVVKECCALYFKENEKAVVFDIILFYCNACTHCMNHIFVAINILTETEKMQAV